MKGRHVSDPRFHLGPMDELYDLVLGMVEKRYDTATRDRFAAWLHSVRPTLAHLTVMLTEMALSGTPMGDQYLILVGFSPQGEPRINFVP
ncbi:MAG: hypothetical protein E6K72_05990 [Candidatus Eisenbacteria bacterium]|uniref:Uncharacterized protein n=1 Tax=Eiseniibacteriota bacterium TaxID=2212470 RepID=A0A538SWW3_UNCEI|nr:MAG: hypothetical protein E6K72_05990 [Candidatus Eisenbacteria bacterium]